MNDVYTKVGTRVTGTGDNRRARNINGFKRWIGSVKTPDHTVSPYQDLSSTRHIERIESGKYIGTLRQTNEGRYILKIEDINKNPVFKLKTDKPDIYWLDATGTSSDIVGMYPSWKPTNLVHSSSIKTYNLADVEVIPDKDVSELVSSLLMELKDRKQTECFENTDDFRDKIMSDKELKAIYLI